MNYRNFSEFSPKQKRIAGGILIAVSALSLFYIVYSDRVLFSNKLKALETATNDFLVQTLPITSDVLTPPPLRDNRGNTEGFLSIAGTFEQTNSARATENLPPLAINPTLNDIAERKLQDMFFYQYFDHVSPTGIGAGDLAKKTGYEYIVIGENLAMGNFSDDAALVTAWMESPGHRENILNARYKEIGIAVRQGLYEGKLTWIAVQEFGRALSDCVQPQQSEKVAIDVEKRNVEAEEQQLNVLKAEIDAWSGKYGPEYGAKVEEYNKAVRQYNTNVTNLKAKIGAYNAQVANFNSCAQD